MPGRIVLKCVAAVVLCVSVPCLGPAHRRLLGVQGAPNGFQPVLEGLLLLVLHSLCFHLGTFLHFPLCVFLFFSPFFCQSFNFCCQMISVYQEILIDTKIPIFPKLCVISKKYNMDLETMTQQTEHTKQGFLCVRFEM